MIVYVLVNSVMHEGDTILGIFSSYENAQKCREQVLSNKSFYIEDLLIETYKLDGEYEEKR